MGDWREVKDPKTGRKYYYNTRTKKTQWTKPADFGAATASAKPAAPAAGGAATVVYIERKDPNSGKTYYINSKTKATQWSVPNGAKVMSVAEWKAWKRSAGAAANPQKRASTNGHAEKNGGEVAKKMRNPRVVRISKLFTFPDEADWEKKDNSGVTFQVGSGANVKEDWSKLPRRFEVIKTNKWGRRQKRQLELKIEQYIWTVSDNSEVKKTFKFAEVKDTKRDMSDETKLQIEFGPPDDLSLYEQLKWREQTPYDLQFNTKEEREVFIKALSFARRKCRELMVAERKERQTAKLEKAHVAHWQVALVLGKHTLPLTMFWQSKHPEDDKPGAIVFKDQENKTRLAMHDEHVKDMKFTAIHHHHKGPVPKDLAGVAPVLMHVDSPTVKSGQLFILFENNTTRLDFAYHAVALLPKQITVTDDTGTFDKSKAKLSESAIARRGSLS